MQKSKIENGNAVLTAKEDRVLETLLNIFQKSVELQTEIHTIEDCLTPQMRDTLEDALTDTCNASSTLVSNTQFIVGSYLSEVIALAHAKKINKEFPIREGKPLDSDTDTVTIPKQEYDEMQRKIGAMEFDENKTE